MRLGLERICSEHLTQCFDTANINVPENWLKRMLCTGRPDPGTCLGGGFCPKIGESTAPPAINPDNASLMFGEL